MLCKVYNRIINDLTTKNFDEQEVGGMIGREVRKRVYLYGISLREVDGSS